MMMNELSLFIDIGELANHSSMPVINNTGERDGIAVPNCQRIDEVCILAWIIEDAMSITCSMDAVTIRRIRVRRAKTRISAWNVG